MGPRKNDWLVSQKEKFQNSKIFVSFLFLRKKLIKFKLNQACKKIDQKQLLFNNFTAAATVNSC